MLAQQVGGTEQMRQSFLFYGQLFLTGSFALLQLGQFLGLLATLLLKVLKGLVQTADFSVQGMEFGTLALVLAAQRSQIVA